MNTLTLAQPRQLDALGQNPSAAWIGRFSAWRQRMHQRRQLGQLDDWQLADIGISRQAARTEAAKPFWRA